MPIILRNPISTAPITPLKTMTSVITPDYALSEASSSIIAFGNASDIDQINKTSSRRRRIAIQKYIFQTSDQVKFHWETLNMVLELMSNLQEHVGPQCGVDFQHKWQEMGVKLNAIMNDVDEFEIQFSKRV